MKLKKITSALLSAAMVATLSIAAFPNYNDNTMILDYHYYLRNSNGSCQNGCGGNCSEWSHKDGHDKVYNTPPKFNQNLCDSNLATYAFNLTPEFALANAYTFLANKTDIRYYYITKDTKVYNSWHGDPTTYATPYYSN